MSIRSKIEESGGRMRGSMREGLRVALEVFDACTCDSCVHFEECQLHEDESIRVIDMCSAWEDSSDD